MSEEIKIWQIENRERLSEIERSKLDFEERLENWLNDDISILSNNLLVIGRQVTTSFGGTIDLLCLNSTGNLVIVELKRHKTPREITAQVLDYASWVKDLSREKILNLAEIYLAKKETNPDEAFQKKFRFELPEVLNDSHGMLIVASEIDESTERIIKYLSDSHGVNINAARFQYFKSQSGQEFLARIFLIEESEVEQKSQDKGTRKRAPFPSRQELEEIAENNQIGALYRKLANGLEGKFIVTTRRTMLNFKGNIENSIKAIFNLVAERSNATEGVYFQIYLLRFVEYTRLSVDNVMDILPPNRKPWKYTENADEDSSGYEGFFKNSAEIERFLAGLEGYFKG